MLVSLCIRHFAIVKQLELDFSQGMTAFTGETGAGKSIMIDALMLALGGRADASSVRPGAESCDITAGFLFNEQSEPRKWLAEHDIAADTDEILLRRVIYAEGRSKSYINGQPMPLQKLKELGEKLVHVHGQHQHQALLQHPTHRIQLDQYAKHPHLLEAVASCYKRYRQLKSAIEELVSKERQDDKIKWLQFQLEELSELAVEEGELEELHQSHQLLHHAKDYLDHGQQIISQLNGDDSLTVCSGLHQILHLIEQLPQEQPAIKNALELVNSALIQCEEAADGIQQFSESISLDPEKLQAIEERMSAIHAMARKYQVDSALLPKQLQSIQEELAAIQNSTVELTRLEQELSQVKRDYDLAAGNLKASRQEAAMQLAKEITQCIQQLGMPRGWLSIESSALDSIQPHGMEKIEYQVCTNPGMAPDTLARVASGGELSRISLAIQMITAEKGATPTVLFDEVDVGIGGATAALVGRMLRQLGERLQVFCVTHQPQVAASAHHHYQVEKQADNTETTTQVIPLSLTRRVDEIARMLGGLKITEQTLFHAKELLETLGTTVSETVTTP